MTLSRTGRCVVAVVVVMLACVACGGATEMDRIEAPVPPSEMRSPGAASEAPSANAKSNASWAPETRSPSARVEHGDAPAFALAMDKCGREDGALDVVARQLALQPRHGEEELARTTELLRRAGLPQVWPRVWVATSKLVGEPASAADARPTPAPRRAVLLAFDENDVALRVERWRAGMTTSGERRCGTSGAISVAGEDRVVFVTVDALADLAPVPTRAHVGKWIRIDASMRVPAASARVVVVGPDGTPRAVPTSFEQSRIRSTFAPDRPGRFVVQLLADVGSGPRPVLEAIVFADVEPFEDESPAPGETAVVPGENNVDALARMITALRLELGLPPFRRDSGLDLLARAHSEKMRAAGRVGHDVGDGDPKSRIERSNVGAFKVGENVAHAQNVVRAHRSLFKSPSHRENLIHRELDRFGVAVVEDADGTVWVTEMFAK